MQDGQPLLLEQRQTAQQEQGRPCSSSTTLQLEVHCAAAGSSAQQLDTISIAAQPWESLQVVKQRACAAFGVDAEVVLLWDYFEACRFMLLEDQLQLSLQQARLGDGQHLLLDPVRQQATRVPQLQQQQQQESRQHAWAGHPQQNQQQQQQQQYAEPAGVAAAAAGLPQDRAAAEELQQLKSCVVCLDAPRSVLLLPCKHLALCEACAAQLQQQRQQRGAADSAQSGAATEPGSAAVPCPVCRVPSTQHIHGVFFS
uniref:RING-type domain-containing protein n=1 Tax=Tetradesmus obliquus TaxID=3088 RepID=A0A383V6A5_TETOB|eukprot:jgi/Sobl393_1/12317/SZX59876.1